MKHSTLTLGGSALLIGALLFSPNKSEGPIETTKQSIQAIIVTEKTRKSVTHTLHIQDLCKSSEHPKITAHKTKKGSTIIRYKCIPDEELIIMPSTNGAPAIHIM